MLALIAGIVFVIDATGAAPEIPWLPIGLALLAFHLAVGEWFPWRR